MKDKIQNYGITKLSLLLLFSMFYFTVHSQTYYFSSSDGDDSRSETEAQDPNTPWKTLDKLDSLSLSPGATILFKRGDTWRGQIEVKNSGSDGNPITFGAYGDGNKPVISGSIVVNGWTQYDGNIYKTTISGNITQLFYKNDRQKVARYPNSGYLTIDAVNNSTSFTDNDVNTSVDWTGANIFIRSNRWRMYTRKITSFGSNGTIELNSAPLYGLHVGWGYTIVNKLEALDSPGEWYFNPSDSTLYFWSPDGTTPETDDVEVTVTNYGLYINSYKDYVTISDLVIENQNLAGIQAKYSSNITINNCDIYNQDEMGIRMGDSQWGWSDENNNIIQNSIIDGANHFGIFYSTNNSEISKTSVRNIGLFENLNASGIGNLNLSSAMAIHVAGHNGGNKIIENRIDNIGYIGIHFSNAPNTQVKYNYVTKCCLTVDDGGGIYTYVHKYHKSGCQGSVVEKNIVMDIIGAPEGTDQPDYYAAEGIYLDGLTYQVTVKDNTVSNCGNTGIFMNRGEDNIYTGNISYNNNKAQIYFREHSHIEDGEETSDVHGIEVNNNVFYSLNSNQKTLTEFSLIYDDTDFGTYNNNYYCNPYSSAVIDHQHYLYTLEGWQAESGQDSASLKSSINVVDSYEPQLISNSTFDSNISGWHCWSSDGNAKNTWETNSLLDGGSLKHDPNGASSSYTSHNVSIEEDSYYELKFSIVSQEHMLMRVAVIKNHGSYESVGLSVRIATEPSKQNFTFLFKGTITDSNSMLYFYNANKAFWIDNVSLRKVEISDPKEVSPLFINPTMETVSINLENKDYRDLDGNIVSGNLTLDAFSSKVLTSSGNGDTIPPAVPSNLTATAMSSSRIDLDWNDNTESDLDNYTVKRATTQGGPYTTIATGVTSSTYSDTRLSPETTYYYVVSAKDNSNNNSGNSAEVSAKTSAAESLIPPYSFYDFEKGSGTTAYDIGSLKNDGTFEGDDVTWATGGVVYNSADETDGCLQITGSTTSGRSHVEIPYNNLHNSDDYTFTAWVKWDVTVATDWAYVFWRNGDDSEKTRHVDMWWDKENKTVSTSMYDENGGSVRIRPTGTTVNIFDGNWHMVAISLEDGKDVKLWVDGQKTGEVNSSVKVVKNDVDDLWLGTMPLEGESDPEAVTKMVGHMDRVGLYDQALTESQISELYTTKSRFDAPSSGTKEFDNGSMFKLYQNTPNPFSSETTIAYELKQSGFVTLQVFDITGQIVTTLEQSEKPAGFYQVKWNRLNTTNHVVPNGIYLYKLVLISKTKVFNDVKKIIVK